jgi:hypothetical protein
LHGRLNVLNGLPITDQDKIDHADDKDYLKRIAAGEVTIEEPLDPLPTPEVQSTSGRPSITEDRRGELNRRVLG